METFKIPISCKVYGILKINAYTLEDAMLFAKKNIDFLPLINESECVYDNYTIENLETAKVINGVL